MATTIDDLPSEVLLDIFVPLAKTSARDRSSLMAVCHHWHTLVVQTSEDVLTSLERHLDRAAAQLLDVTCQFAASLPVHLFPRIQNLLRRAPFSRWRSLRLEERRSAAAGTFLDILRDDPGFVNLESLHLVLFGPNKLLSRVNETIGPRFRSFTMSGHWPTAELVRSSLNRVLRRVPSIRICDIRMLQSDCLPPNITELDTACIPRDTFPYITTLHSKFLPSHHFPSLTTLHLKAPLSVTTGKGTTLPTLRSLLIHGPNYFPLQDLCAPLLCSLSLLYDGHTSIQHQRSSADRVMNESIGAVFGGEAKGYKLAPSELYIRQPFPTAVLQSILLHSPAVTTLGITCENIDTAQEILEDLVYASETCGLMEPDEEPTFALCPELSSLEIIAMWDDVDDTVEWSFWIFMLQVQELRGLLSVKCSYHDGTPRKLVYY